MRGYNYNIIEIDLSSGLDDERYEYEGEKIIYLSGKNEIYIKLWDTSQDLIPLRPKHEIAAKFRHFFITAPSSSETITLLIAKPASLQLNLKQVDVDNVNTIGILNARYYDYSDYCRTKETKNVFIGEINPSSTSGYYPIAIIENPNNSGIIAIIQRISVTTATPLTISLGQRPAGTYSGGAAWKKNKYIGQSSPTLELKDGDLASYYIDIMARHYVAAGMQCEFLKKDAIVLPENYQLLLLAHTTGSYFAAQVEWIELSE